MLVPGPLTVPEWEPEQKPGGERATEPGSHSWMKLNLWFLANCFKE